MGKRPNYGSDRAQPEQEHGYSIPTPAVDQANSSQARHRQRIQPCRQHNRPPPAGDTTWPYEERHETGREVAPNCCGLPRGFSSTRGGERRRNSWVPACLVNR
jgi:hypothetical protein